MPGDRQRLYDALLKADAAGDTAGAKVLADYIRSLPAEEAPAPAEESDGGGALRTRILSAADTAPFAKQIGAGFRVAGALARQGATLDTEPIDIAERYRQERDAITAGLEADQAANPVAAIEGTVLGIGAQLVSGGVNPLTVARGVGSGLRGLLTGEGIEAAGRSLLTREAAKTAGQGAATGAAYGLSESEADLTRGEFGPAAADALEGAAIGGAVGLGARGLLAAGSKRTGALAASAADDAALAGKVGPFDEAAAMLPAQQAAVKAGNAEVVAAAKAEGKALTKAKQAEAQGALREKTLANPLVRTGLEGKQSTLRGPKRARERAQALVDEPLPGDPTKKLVDEAEKLSPADRLEYATGLRRAQGAQLGKIRDELAKTEIPIPVEPIRAEMRGAFGELPTEVQGRALEQVDAIIGKVAKDGALTPDALRKVITDAESFSKFSTPSLEAALGNARGRVFQTARAVLVNYEQAALAKARPDLVPEYVEGLRKYGVYSDFELGSDVFFRRANRGKPTVAIPKAGKVEPEVVQPVLLPEPQAPQFPGGDEALAKGRALLQPSAGAQAGAEAIRAGLPALAGSAGYAAGGYLTGAVATFAGAKLAQPAANLWLRVMTPTAGSLSKSAQKLERLRPLMEEAVQKGPAEVARVHALFMQRSPDYRKAIESGE